MECVDDKLGDSLSVACAFAGRPRVGKQVIAKAGLKCRTSLDEHPTQTRRNAS
jgi:hypothetical protein